MARAKLGATNLKHRFNARRNVYWTDGRTAWGVYDEERDPLPDGEPVAMFREKGHATAFLTLLRRSKR